jgi:hypothetical protein
VCAVLAVCASGQTNPQLGFLHQSADACINTDAPQRVEPASSWQMRRVLLRHDRVAPPQHCSGREKFPPGAQAACVDAVTVWMSSIMI